MDQGGAKGDYLGEGVTGSFCQRLTDHGRQQTFPNFNAWFQIETKHLIHKKANQQC